MFFVLLLLKNDIQFAAKQDRTFEHYFWIIDVWERERQRFLKLEILILFWPSITPSKGRQSEAEKGKLMLSIVVNWLEPKWRKCVCILRTREIIINFVTNSQFTFTQNDCGASLSSIHHSRLACARVHCNWFRACLRIQNFFASWILRRSTIIVELSFQRGSVWNSGWLVPLDIWLPVMIITLGCNV